MIAIHLNNSRRARTVNERAENEGEQGNAMAEASGEW